MKKMINYILINEYKSIIFEQGIITEYEGREGIIKIIANDHLVDIKSYRMLVKRKIGFERDIPLYLSSNLIFIRIKNDDEYYINLAAILCITRDKDIIKIEFVDNTILIIKYPYNRYLKYQEKARIIKEYLHNREKNYIW